MSQQETTDREFMMRCVQLAKNGLGTTYPNPMVGSVIVYDNKIIGEGWHYKSGQPHAEVMAVNSVKDKSLLSKATIYVSLEPCSFVGKTPACADLIIDHKIPKVVIGSLDPHPKVSGTGVKRLRKAGIEVRHGICQEETDALNKRFFTFHKKRRPYIILKWAATKDGFIAPSAQKQGEPFWITSPESKQLVHLWRSQENAIMVGTNTAIKDNPKLGTREVFGNNPIRLAIDKSNRIPTEHFLLDQSIPSIIFNEVKDYEEENLSYKKSNWTKDIPEQILDHCYEQNIQSIFIEGGTYLLQSFIDKDLWDEARVFVGNKKLGKGIAQAKLRTSYTKQVKSGKDLLQYYYLEQ